MDFGSTLARKPFDYLTLKSSSYLVERIHLFLYSTDKRARSISALVRDSFGWAAARRCCHSSCWSAEPACSCAAQAFGGRTVRTQQRPVQPVGGRLPLAASWWVLRPVQPAVGRLPLAASWWVMEYLFMKPTCADPPINLPSLWTSDSSYIKMLSSNLELLMLEPRR